MKKIVYIYIILNPVTNEVKYVGKTLNTKRRFYQHLHTKLNSYCSKWIYSLLEKNIIPEFVIIDEVYEDNWQFYEEYWISQFKSWGFNLTNLTSGGEGCNNRCVSEQTRKNISINQKGEKGYWFGKKFSKEHIEKIIRKNDKHHFFGKTFSEEHKLKLSNVNKGKILSEITKQKISDSLKGKNNPVSKKVINLETSIIYDTIKDAALDNDIKYTTLFSYLSGKSKNKTKLVFYDNK